jgi:hypothetical protein
MFLVSDEIPGPKFDPETMRKYQPDYRPLRDYEQELTKNSAKGSLVRAALAAKADEIPRPRMQFRADTDTALRQEITEAQKPLAVLDSKLNEMQTLLEAGEKDRSRLTTPRWRASYDLAAGRVMAMRARAYGYNVLLAEMKLSPKSFQDKNNNTWRLIPAEQSHAGARIDKLEHKAKEYLNRVIEEHPGTPWELLAKEELLQPLGWQWQEFSVNYPPPPQPAADPNPRPLEDPRRRMNPKTAVNLSLWCSRARSGDLLTLFKCFVKTSVDAAVGLYRHFSLWFVRLQLNTDTDALPSRRL